MTESKLHTHTLEFESIPTSEVPEDNAAGVPGGSSVNIV